MSLFGIKEKKLIEELRYELDVTQKKLYASNHQNEILKKQCEKNELLSDEINKLKELIKSAGGEALIDIAAATEKVSDENQRARSENLHLQVEREQLKQKIDSLNQEIFNYKQEILSFEDQINYETFALYTPHFSFTSSTEYKMRIDQIRAEQKEMIKSDEAVYKPVGWTVNNNAAKGKKMVNDFAKLAIRSFNNECDTCVSAVKFNNIDVCVNRINKSYEAINRTGTIMDVRISVEYLNSKISELYLAYEYQQKKQEEKETQKMLREQLREEKKLQQEIEFARKEAEKERKHYENALKQTEIQLIKCQDDIEKSLLEEKLGDYQERLGIINDKMAEIDYRESNKRAGYVYIISNIGAFGENVYKIGMTRRLEPLERIDELSGASVPFKFDVHAMIFSDDAPTLENSLHKAFESRKINMINGRKEFFNVTIEEIEEVIKANYDKTVNIEKIPEAEQYRETQKIKSAI